MIKKSSFIFVSLLSVVLLTSCAKKTVKKTVAASVNYKTAKKLPPLNKHSTLDNSEIYAQDNFVQNKPKLEASLKQTRKGSPFILIDSKPKVAWDQLEAALDRANVTVYGRNKEAGQFFVSCGDDNSQPISTKKDKRFLIFKSKVSYSPTEYCALLTDKYRGNKTSVKLVSRKGKIMKNEYANTLYNKILSN